MVDDEGNPIITHFECHNFNQGVLSSPFVNIFISTTFMNIEQIFLSLNFRAYGLMKLNDDHLVTSIINWNSIFGSISCIYWGYYIDKFSFK